MDIHRCRFVPYPPSAINAVAFSHSQVTKAQKNAPVRLAIGRANGDIEIWNPLNGQWHQEKILHGGRDRSIDGLVWVVEPDQVLEDGTTIVGKSRLFSIGYTSTVTEWDLENGRPRKQASGPHGDIWCLAAQPLVKPGKDGRQIPVRNGKKLIAGTIDGSLVIYSIDDDDLRFDRVLVRSTSKKTRMVSMAFQNYSNVVVGCSDSAIRVYDVRNNGTLSRKMTLGSDLAGGAKEIIVWSVKCLKNHDIVSGDSTGHVCIWDGKTYTQVQRLQSHKQDVLSLATSADGSAIVSGGMDRRTVLYRMTTGSVSRWSKVWHRRYHSHDVKTMASFEGNGISVVVSAGPDANPIVIPLREAGMENHRTLSHLPQDPPVLSAPRARLIVSYWDREVHIWRLRKPLSELANLSGLETDVDKNRKLLARILIKGEANITSAAISPDGALLFVSTTSDIKAFYLRPRGETRADELKISRVDIPTRAVSVGAAHLKISPDGQWLCMAQEGSQVSLLRIIRETDTDNRPAIHPMPTKLRRLPRRMPKHVALGGLGQYDRSITQLAFSPDSKMLAVADMSGYIDTWVIGESRPLVQNGAQQDDDDDGSSSDDASDAEENDTDGFRWRRNAAGSLLPKLHGAPTLLSFSDHVPAKQSTTNDDDDYVLLATTAKPQILLLNPRSGAIAPWSRRNPFAGFPVEFRNIRDLVKGALWAGDRVWFYGDSFLAMLDTSQDIVKEPLELIASAGPQPTPKKRKRGADTGAGNRMQIGAAGPRKVERYVKGNEDAEQIDLDAMDIDERSSPEDDSDSENSEDELKGELAKRREAEGIRAVADFGGPGTGFWHTFKYRPILGIVPLDDVEEEADEDNMTPFANGVTRKTLEVALIERPLWETEMQDRYVGEGEYER